MALDDRERNFEKALARALRPKDLSAGDFVACAGAEILAAYHERLLAPEETIFWKEHISLCARCMEILAQLESTDELPVDVLEEETRSPELVLAGRSAQPREAAGAAPAAMGASRFRQEISRLPRMALWRSVVPAALAAGLLLWLAIRHQPAAPSSSKPVEMAQVQQPAAAPPPARPSRQPQSGVSRTDTVGQLNSEQMKKRLRPEAKVLRDSAEAEFFSQLEKPSEEPHQAAPRQGNQAAKNSASVPEILTLSPGVLQPKDQHADSKLSSPAAAPRVSSLEAVTATGQSVTVEIAPAPPLHELITNGRSIAGGAVTRRDATARVPALVSAPGGKELWRIGSAGIVERSGDSGVNWKIQPSGVIANLLAGSAPSGKICWIVGAAGTILRTTDGGEHWQKLHAPVAEDFNAVFAVDSEQATVTAILHGETYRTTDGGSTWRSVPNR